MTHEMIVSFDRLTILTYHVSFLHKYKVFTDFSLEIWYTSNR